MNQIIQLDLADLRTEIRKALMEVIREIDSTSGPEPETTGGIQFACEILNRSRSWVYKATANNKLPFKKFGSSLIFDRAELLQYMNEKTVDPSQGLTQINDAITQSARAKLSNGNKFSLAINSKRNGKN